MTKKDKVHRRVTSCGDCPMVSIDEIYGGLDCNIDREIYIKSDPTPPLECPLRKHAVILYLEEDDG
jgi:hypothetical protein